MADILISALPTWTGTAADVRWFVMNNSGNTETFKFSGYTSQLILASTGNQTYQTPVSNTNGKSGGVAIGSGATLSSTSTVPGDVAIGLNAVTAGGYGGIAIGRSVTATGGISKAVAIGDTVTVSNRGIGIGNAVTSSGDGSVAIGLTNTASAETAIAIGGDVNVSQLCGIGIGRIITNSGARSIVMGLSNTATQQYSVTLGSSLSNSSPFSNMIGGATNTLNSSGNYNNMFNGTGNTIGGTFSGVTMLSCFSRTATRSNATFVENLVIPGYATLDYANDAAAAAGGVVLGQVYHTAGTLKIRIV
jgi:hypothetical protein